MIIYVAGYPKSGTTWITRLLGDALECRTGGSVPQQDSREIATEGLERPNFDCIVRKGHFVLNDTAENMPVQRAHQMYWKGIRSGEHKVVFVIRDPRDIAVSSAHHWNIPVDSSLKNMFVGTNGFRSVGPWHVYIDKWLTQRDQFFDFVTVTYEEMLEGPKVLVDVLTEMHFHIDASNVAKAYERQSFENRVKHIEEHGDKYRLGKEFNQKFMRKGVAGDWRNYFTREEAFMTEATFGDLLKLFNYEKDSDWWKEVT